MGTSSLGTGRALLLGLAIGAAANAATANAATANAATGDELSQEEARCQMRTVGGARGFVGAKLVCVRRCAREALEGRVPPTDCRPPYAGSTARCVVSRESRAMRRMEGGSCALACPPCYAGGDCVAAAGATVGRIETAIDVLVPMVYCEESGGPGGLTHPQQSCVDHIAAELRRFALDRFACLRLCRRRVDAGQVPAAACVTPLGTNPDADPDTVACITEAEHRSAVHIDGTCQRDAASLACHGGRTGSDWTALVGATVDGEVDALLCGSASGAFVSD